MAAVALALASPLAAMGPTPAPAGAAGGPTISTVAGAFPRSPATAVPQQPEAVALRGSTLYVADSASPVVRALDLATGDEPIVAGTGSVARPFPPPADDGRLATEVLLGSPMGLAFDAAGHLYVADAAYARVRKVDGAGRITTVAGNGTSGSSGDGGPATSAQLRAPKGLAVDGAGNLYVAEVEGRRVRKVDPSGVITTVAGTGGGDFAAPGPVGDGGPATSAPLRPEGIALDGAGNLYVVDSFHRRVRKVDAAGTITTVAGGGGAYPGDGVQATSASFLSLSQVAVGADGVLHLCDGYQVRTVDTSGTVHVVAGANPPSGPVGDGGPALAATVWCHGLAVDPAGGFYVADATTFRVRRVDGGGTITTVAGNGTRAFSGDGGPATQARLSAGDVAVDTGGNLYIADPESDRVRKVATNGIITTVAGGGPPGFVGDGGPAIGAGLIDPSGVAVDGTGNVYVVETGAGRVRKVDPTGTITTVAGGGGGAPGAIPDGGPATAGALNTPMGVAVGTGGELFVAEPNAFRVRRVDPAGTISTVAGNGTEGSSGDGGPATAASFRYPREVAVTAAGELLVVDTLGGVVRKVDRFGVVTTVAGTPQFGFAGDGQLATSAAFAFPAAVAADASGNVFVSDLLNHRVRRVDPLGTITTLAGTGEDGSTGDGGPAASARLSGPVGLAVRNTDLYVGEAGLGRVRRISGGAGLPPASAAVAFGLNHVGQLGTGTTTDQLTPSPSAAPAGLVRLAAGYYHSLAVGHDGRARAWGWNRFGQLGTGGGADATVPTLVPGVDGVVGVAAGAYHSLAVRRDGTVWAWGWNAYGQLGDGTSVDRHVPVRVTGLDGVVAVAAGGLHSLALRSDGTVWAWGLGHVGQLGNGIGQSSPVPVAVPGLRASALAAGAFHTLAVKTDGTVWAWGLNGHGELGTGTTTDALAPVRVPGLTGVTAVAAGTHHSLALQANGALWTWGLGHVGQLGRGSTADSRAPVRATGMADVRFVGAGAFHTLAVTGDGRLWAWGWNHFAQLGTGTRADALSPRHVGYGGRAVAAGVGHSAALVAPGPAAGASARTASARQLLDADLVTPSR